MTWSKMRDDLIAQTKAFVQSVNGGKQQLTPQPASVGAAPIEEPFAELVSDFVANTAPSETSVAAEPIERAEQTDDLPSPPALSPRPPALSEVRREIQTRVAAFQAHQHRFHREREAYFNSVLTKVRSDIEKGPDAPTLS
ncbi:hypothetical protein [Bradyrhizobium sp. S69]|uniref:hypothetical protein n=1 Tax=Bradyrhizobium sp. S69 TaxID=1641856 RepID=UPI001AEDDD8A|nr:hypothetical protein [Bradyrhizobium sp. S69]